LRWHLIDTHCHIDTPAFDEDRRQVIGRASEARIALINSGINLESNYATRGLLEFENVYASYGLSPLYAGEKKHVEEFISRNVDSAISIGEVGLDFYHVKDKQQRLLQKDVFKQFVKLSQEFNLPLVVHSRDAEEDVFELVRKVDQVVYHCYGGSLQLLNAIAECGHYISVPTRVCRSRHHQEIAKNAPRNLVVIETDSPYLAARKERNEPLFVADAVTAISRIWELSIKNAASIILKNTCSAFNLA
jgi:TatD DNase family protein